MKIKKFVPLTLVSLVALTIAGSTLAFGGWGMMGFGGQNLTPEEQAQHFTEMMGQQANLLGISQEQMKAYWAEGKNLKEIAEAQGLTQEQLQTKMQNARAQNMQEHLQVLVSQGVITQEQADARLANVANKGFGGMMGFGGKRGGGDHPCPFAKGANSVSE